jgi:hypothetical protein
MIMRWSGMIRYDHGQGTRRHEQAQLAQRLLAAADNDDTLAVQIKKRWKLAHGRRAPI